MRQNVALCGNGLTVCFPFIQGMSALQQTYEVHFYALYVDDTKGLFSSTRRSINKNREKLLSSWTALNPSSNIPDIQDDEAF